MKIIIVFISLMFSATLLWAATRSVPSVVFQKPIPMNGDVAREMNQILRKMNFNLETFKLTYKCDRYKANPQDSRAEPINCYAVFAESDELGEEFVPKGKQTTKR